MKEELRIQNWKLAWIENAALKAQGIDPRTPAALEACGLCSIDAAVPGNVELDLMREGLLPDIYMGTNTLLTQELEARHWFYHTSFEFAPRDGFDAFAFR